MDDEDGTAICAYSACDRRVDRRGQQGAVPKRYCSNSCRTRASQERRLRELQYPTQTLRRAVIRAHDALDTEAVDDALALEAVTPDVRRNLLKARDVLAEIARRIPDSSE